MSAAVRTTVTELPESRVRVDAEVPAEEIERRLTQKARALGRELKIPGFRKGKVPPPLVLQRIGREAVLDETVRDSLARWYIDAIDAAGIAPVGDPELGLGELPAEGQSLSFTIEIGVRPAARLGEYRGLEIGRREAAVDPEDVQRELDALRERMAKLETADRPAADEDFVVIDYVGSIDGVPFEGGAGRDQLVELGSERLLPGFEGLKGASAGEQRTLEVTFPEDYGDDQLAGRPATLEVTVKEVKSKRLPELDEDFAADAGFDTVGELREDISKRMLELDERRITAEFREAALDAAVAEATVEVPPALVKARASELFERMVHSLSQQGITKETYLHMSGSSEEELLAEAAPEAEQALRRDAVIAAIVEAEQIDPSDEELVAALEPMAERENTTAAKLVDALRSSGRIDDVRQDLAARRAVDVVVEAARTISVEQARARGALWTPEKAGSEGAPAQLWTPGSKVSAGPSG